VANVYSPRATWTLVDSVAHDTETVESAGLQSPAPSHYFLCFVVFSLLCLSAIVCYPYALLVISFASLITVFFTHIPYTLLFDVKSICIWFYFRLCFYLLRCAYVYVYR
jgi:hypothetical protein